ncbi:hydroxyethylthiazole kinase [Legionella taurinensis]|uniref:Hydroxyethylthiazole kinase n=1 Tax=Legionella taurinensis TaxID=70611 RepID=A0A3A5LAK6_9GAMM|nr:hydroxyethylthiazole kinase [Legionella taurinensis]MDX1837010.1 hydroxyethylthiazole kinase [Legionella taurinensis]PUT41416.1 hydroxyethylthiazole kinase [Legionella taurinensis]PUT42655.1 hydroxyethylthiazole kinase [Legionella taurinensis]PUT46683.1 hydroxyethylthiazole kinase [Legionella taurinensis]PUT47332.1 hydroxyethylthiazole kinase [Legionella taurinensis]
MRYQLDTRLQRLRAERPLVLCLTNAVTVNFVANSLLALGAPPIMSQADDELEALIAMSQALYVNIGTLDRPFIERIDKACRLAAIHQKPIILDPVGAGASQIRTLTARQFAPQAAIIRGNASEIMALTADKSISKGVETLHSVQAASSAALSLSQQTSAIVVVSGPVDFITDGRQCCQVPYGSPLMPLVTGMGCALTAIIAAFAAMETTFYEAAAAATAYVGLCGQSAHRLARGPASFQNAFIDALYQTPFEERDYAL